MGVAVGRISRSEGFTAKFQASWQDLDWALLLIPLILVGVGLAMIYSTYEVSMADTGGDLWQNAVFRQGVFALVGLALYFVMVAIDYHLLTSVYVWIYLFVLGSLALTAIMGHTQFGAQAWLRIQGQGLQPSELGKVLMILVLAKVLGVEDQKLESGLPFLLSLVLVVPPAILIYLQPDFGLALLLVVTWLGMAFLAGVRWRHLLILGAIGLALAPVVWFRLEGYMRDRILMFFLSDYDPSGASYNVNQALISIGSGGLWGKGYLNGTQSQLYFLRVRHTDFIFSVWAEEFGFMGSALLLGLFGFMFVRLIRVALAARDAAGRVIAGGVAAMLLAQTLINLGMNANILPVTGLTLPLVSYGGSSLVTTLMALGMAQGVLIRSRSTDFTLL